MQLDRLDADLDGESGKASIAEREGGEMNKQGEVAPDESQKLIPRQRSEARPKTEMFCPFTRLL